MPLPSFLQRFRRDRQPAAPADLNAPAPMDVEVARTRARRRLIGMLVLVVSGVLGFPWLFETQPRPMSQDVQIVQAPSAGGSVAADAGQPSGRALSGRVGVASITPPVAQASAPAPDPEIVETEAAPSVPVAPVKPVVKAPVSAKAVADKPAQDKPAPKVADKASAKPQDKPAEKPAEKSAARQAEAKPAASKPDARHDTKVAAADKKPADKKADDKKPEEKKPADKPKEPAKDSAKDVSKDKDAVRYVVQFGAFADPVSAQAARAKVEKLGIKTYAQTVDTPAGKRTRVRIGPYADKAEAEKANATLRKAGLAGSVLTL